jgi:SAM-dependent methyltransferase
VFAVVSVVFLAIVACHFPYATDDPARREDELKAFYEIAYSDEQAIDRSSGERGKARFRQDIPQLVTHFVDRYRLHDAKVLDIGSGTGYLQDHVKDYTGIDISSAAVTHYHKPFVAGTATAMPFSDDSFDAAWSIWVLEHIPNPETALTEIRRVLKPQALLLLLPAYHVPSWAADGYAVRPYSDFGLGGKLVKASIPVRSHPVFMLLTTFPNRAIRRIASLGGPTRLHYRRLEPNYREWWQSDSDAVNSLDAAEIAMWFTSRGDDCLNCSKGAGLILQPNGPLIIRIAE